MEKHGGRCLIAGDQNIHEKKNRAWHKIDTQPTAAAAAAAVAAAAAAAAGAAATPWQLLLLIRPSFFLHGGCQDSRVGAGSCGVSASFRALENCCYGVDGPSRSRQHPLSENAPGPRGWTRCVKGTEGRNSHTEKGVRILRKTLTYRY